VLPKEFSEECPKGILGGIPRGNSLRNSQKEFSEEFHTHRGEFGKLIPECSRENYPGKSLRKLPEQLLVTYGWPVPDLVKY